MKYNQSKMEKIKGGRMQGIIIENIANLYKIYPHLSRNQWGHPQTMRNQWGQKRDRD